VEWETFHQQVRRRVTPAAWQTWIEPLASSVESGSLRLVAPTDFHYRWVGDRYLPALQEAAMDTLGLDVELSVVPTVVASSTDISSSPEPRQVSLPIDTVDPTRRHINDPRLVPKYTFDNFVVGQSNRFAHAAALAVAEQPGSHYNPLFIYANAGLGKTHLLHAVGHHRIEFDPMAVVRYVSSEQFFNEFINGIRRKRMDEFKDRYRTIDVLLLDDVQFFEGKEQILEEFFHTCLLYTSPSPRD